MQTETPAQFATALRWLHFPVWIVVASLIGFILTNLHSGRRWFTISAIGNRIVSLLPDFMTEQNLTYKTTR